MFNVFGYIYTIIIQLHLTTQLITLFNNIIIQ